MVTVKTKEEFKKALENQEKKILVLDGPLAEDLRKRKKRSTVAKFGGAALLAAGIAAIPFTGGLSIAGAVAGAGLTVGAFTITAAELAIIFGGSAAIIGILKGMKVKLNSDGSVEVSPAYKD